MNQPQPLPPEPDLEPAQPPPPPRQRPLLHLTLLLLTFVTTLLGGAFFYEGFLSSSAQEVPEAWGSEAILNAFSFSATLLAILLAHESGHYFACRYYGIQATLPFVIPAPPALPLPPPIAWLLGAPGVMSFAWIPFNPFGTFGAVIRIRSPFRDRRQLFDVGIAGPLAGFVVILPALMFGLLLSRDFVPLDSEGFSYEFGEPLLFRLAVLLFYQAGDGSSITLHPVGMAAWFGMLATSLNLLPAGQLDGGHIVYSLFGPRAHRVVSLLTLLGLVLISLWSFPAVGYLVFAALVSILGLRHPPPSLPVDRLGRNRMIIAIVGLLIFIFTFIPIPIQIIENVVRL